MKKNTDCIVAYVQEELKNAETGHDWYHIERVWKNALLILKEEKGLDEEVVIYAALLHDISDSKFYDGDEEIAPKKAGDFLHSLGLSTEKIQHVQQIIRHMSYKNNIERKYILSREMEVVQDADRLDAIGAIGIARAFNYGGFKNRPLYDPAIKPLSTLDKAKYKNSTAPTINHFYEKLLQLKDHMNTAAASNIAHERHLFMEQFLVQFYAEWQGEK